MREDEPFSNPIAPAGHQSQQDDKDDSKPLSNDDFRWEMILYKADTRPTAANSREFCWIYLFTWIRGFRETRDRRTDP